jgi:hypothetical protein
MAQRTGVYTLLDRLVKHSAMAGINNMKIAKTICLPVFNKLLMQESASSGYAFVPLLGIVFVNSKSSCPTNHLAVQLHRNDTATLPFSGVTSTLRSHL